MIHQYKNNGYNIILDVNSGAVHVVDDIVYDVIEEYNKMKMPTADLQALIRTVWLRSLHQSTAGMMYMKYVTRLKSLQSRGVFLQEIYMNLT